MADLNLWLKVQSGDDLFLSDIPELIPYRWLWFKDNWEFFKPELVAKIDTFANPSLLKFQIDNFSTFVEIQRHATSNINPFDSNVIFHRYYLVWDAIAIDSAPVSDTEQSVIDKNVRRIKNFSKNEFLKIRANVVEARDRQADLISTTDPDYNATFHRGAVPPYLLPSIEDMNVIQQYMNSIKTIDFILANIFSLEKVFVDPFALAKANANNPEIDIKSYSSGRLVRINYGEDLMSLANRYLGDPDKWIDIAIANGLKPPYIDEVGERLPLLSNGSQNLINISKTDFTGQLNKGKFFINQIVVLQSDTQTFPEQRIIVNIREVPVSGEIIVELNGDGDLDRYKTAENANIRVYKPNTVNSQLFVLIPSNEPVEDIPGDTPWFLRTSGEDEKKAKVDLALGDNSDLNFTPSGDLQLSFGLANAIQAIKLKILVEIGSLQRHPEFGLIQVQGKTNQDVQGTKSAIVDSLNKQIERDPRFERVESLDVEYFGNGIEGPVGYLISLVVRLAGGNKVIPISFTVNV